MKTLHTIILLALLNVAKPVSAKGTHAELEKITETEKSKSINLEIKGLFKNLKEEWNIPNTHVIYLNLVPKDENSMNITDVETENERLQKMLNQYFKEKKVDVKSKEAIRVRVLLSN